MPDTHKPHYNNHDSLTGTDWKRKRDAFLEGKSCLWCGSSENLVLAQREQVTPYLFRLREKTADFLKLKIDAGEFRSEAIEGDFCPSCSSRSLSHRKCKKPSYRCLNCRHEFDTPVHKVIPTGRLSREDWDLFWKKYSPEIKQMVMEERRKSVEEYYALRNCIALCRRCHFARLRGLSLCPVCKKGYRKPGNDMCWECFKKTDKGKDVLKRFEQLSYVHPWCGNAFPIERQFWDLAADPEVCCLEICSSGPSKCEVAQKHWDNESQLNEQAHSE